MSVNVTRDDVFNALDRHTPMPGYGLPDSPDYCDCGAVWGPAHLVGVLFGDDEFGGWPQDAVLRASTEPSRAGGTDG